MEPHEPNKSKDQDERRQIKRKEPQLSDFLSITGIIWKGIQYGMGKKAQTGSELYGKQQQNKMEGIKSRNIT